MAVADLAAWLEAGSVGPAGRRSRARRQCRPAAIHLRTGAVVDGITKATGARGNTSCLVGTAGQVADAILAYYRLGISSFLIRGFYPVVDTTEFGRELIPRIKAGA